MKQTPAYGQSIYKTGFNPFPNDKFYTPPNSKTLHTTISNLVKNGGKLSKRVGNSVKKGEIARYNFSFPYSVFKGLVLQTRKN